MQIKILVFRFSSFGDVAMVVPVITQFLEQNSKVRIIFVSQKIYYSLFKSINRLEFYGIDLKKYKSLLGLYKLYLELRSLSFDYVIDLHNVLRTRLLIFFFKKKFILDKARIQKRNLTRKKNKYMYPLDSMHESYAQVFREAGFSLKLENNPIEIPKLIKSIGIAPFASYQEKIYPLKKMKNIALILAKNNKKIILFGKGEHEKKELKFWEGLHCNIHSIVGKFSLDEELKYLKNLDVLICMDSSNMHLASLVRTPCISIWGATHRYGGFLGFNQKIENCIESTEVPCRPCSIFGNKKCYRNDLLCMNSIDEWKILKKIL